MNSDETLSSREGVAQHLMFISGYVHRLLRYEARNLEIRWTALMVLRDLQLLGPVSQRTLAEIEQVSAPTMSVLIQQMARRGWVRREGEESDARVSLVAITPDGRKELKKIGRILRRKLETELSDLPQGVIKNLQADLGTLSGAIMVRINSSGT